MAFPGVVVPLQPPNPAEGAAAGERAKLLMALEPPIEGAGPAYRPLPPHLTLAQFRQLEAVLRAHGYGEMIDWSEQVPPPANAAAFARAAIYVICNSGMNNLVANGIYWKCVRALRRGHSSTTVFGHPGKTKAIDHIWQHRKTLFAGFEIAENKVAYCETLPFIGAITKHHLAKNLGVYTIKPDVHLMRLAKREQVSPVALCARLAYLTGYKLSTIDSILWRACADGYVDSATYRTLGWYDATQKLREEMRLIDGSSC